MSVAMAVVKGRNGIDIGALVAEALHDCDMQHKEAWVQCGYPDASQFSKALKGGAPLDLWALRHLPNRYWQAFLPLFASALIRQFLVEETHDQLRMAKATLHDVHEAKRSA